MELLSLAIILGLAVFYGFLNGLNSSASVVATIISSRAMAPRTALVLAAATIAIGPFALGMAVASTTVHFIEPEATTPNVIVAAMIGAISWILITFYLSIPCSISQSLFGGIIGAAWMGYGLNALAIDGITKILIALFLSPILGSFMAYWMVKLTYFLSASSTPHINHWFNRWQILAAILLGISFGANAGQKTIAIMVLGLIAAHINTHFFVPQWTVILSAVTISIGTLTGGWRIIRTLGGKFYKIRPIHGFGAQLASALIIFGAAVLGGPVSESQVVTSSIIGAGSADRFQKVRWKVTQQILAGWILTLPFSILSAAAIYKLLESIAWIP